MSYTQLIFQYCWIRRKLSSPSVMVYTTYEVSGTPKENGNENKLKDGLLRRCKRWQPFKEEERSKFWNEAYHISIESLLNVTNKSDVTRVHRTIVGIILSLLSSIAH